LPELNKSGAEGHVEWESKEETKAAKKGQNKSQALTDP